MPEVNCPAQNASGAPGINADSLPAVRGLEGHFRNLWDVVGFTVLRGGLLLAFSGWGRGYSKSCRCPPWRVAPHPA